MTDIDNVSQFTIPIKDTEIRVRGLREDRKKFLLYPEDDMKDNWDLFMTLVLLITSVATPIRIAFYETDDLEWTLINYAIDFAFLVDIFMSFNTAYYDKDFKIVDNRFVIAYQYAKGWFLIDLLSIFPFELVALLETDNDNSLPDGSSEINELSRVARLGRIQKTLKLTRLIRVVKIFKNKGRFFRYFRQFLKLSKSFERLFFFILINMLIVHILTCLWIFFAQFQGYYGTWMDPDFMNFSGPEQYIVSLYFTWESCTTIAYGDITQSNDIEKIFCIGIEILGVMGFTAAMGTITRLIYTHDTKQLQLQRRIGLLNRIHKMQIMPTKLVEKVKLQLKY